MLGLKPMAFEPQVFSHSSGTTLHFHYFCSIQEQKQKEQREQEEQLRKDEEARREELYMSLKQIREEQKKASMKERDQADKIFQVQCK